MLREKDKFILTPSDLQPRDYSGTPRHDKTFRENRRITLDEKSPITPPDQLMVTVAQSPEVSSLTQVRVPCPTS